MNQPYYLIVGVMSLHTVLVISNVLLTLSLSLFLYNKVCFTGRGFMYHVYLLVMCLYDLALQSMSMSVP
jgi:hypothetical protein